MRRVTHRLCPPRNNHVLLTKLNTPRRKNNSLHPGRTNLPSVPHASRPSQSLERTHLVNGGGDGGVGETCPPRDLSSGILSEIGAEDTAKDTFLDTRCGDPGAFHRG